MRRGSIRGLAFVSCAAILAGVLAACGSDDQSSVFVVPSPTGSVTPSGTAAASSKGSPTAQPPNTGTAPTPIPQGSHIIIDSPDGGSAIQSPVAVSGTASVSNGTVVGVVLDDAGNELGRGTGTASAAAPSFGHYDLTINFSGATSGARGQLKVYGVRQDGTTPTYYYFIIIRFG